MKHTLKLLITGSSGWLLGLLSYERLKERWQLSNFFTESPPCGSLPCLPRFGTVSAAVPDSSIALIPPEPPTNASRVAKIMRFGFPSLGNVRSYEDFILSYDNRNRVPHWVFEHLTLEDLKRKNVDRSLCNFHVDESIHGFFRSSNEDYKGSGYDRGHLAAAGNHRVSQSSCDETFMLSNIAPQVGPGFNRDAWNGLEKHVRSLTKQYKNVYVCTGPLYLPEKTSDGKMYVSYQVIGKNHVAVPTHFFKVVVGEDCSGDLHMECYVMPNAAIDSNKPLDNFMVPPEAVERAAGLLFFDKISRQKLRSINYRKMTYV